ncbi:MAG: hypothetical protein A3K19_08020 [Lentisphaerae bacterium RIFOXYB12_FULL_65_16]|nr:MAG: hypothetical protein A3K18_08810 [Lentisphaerae bacterium RIFOXYA12_64_32]OGV87594.1 MAG: hypothetical protein A3K19_08020 [Lentisphaerae bacterium RIFOXYB12_FULL_65_16]
MAGNMDIGACISYGIERLKANPMFYIVGMVIVMAIEICITVVSELISFVFGFVVGFVGAKLALPTLFVNMISACGGGLIGAVLGILLAPFMVGYLRGIKTEYEGGTAEVGVVFSGFDVVIPSLLNYALATVVVVVGFFCCIIPGILLSPLTGLVIYFIVKGETTGIRPFTKGFELLKTQPMVILWTILLWVLGLVGLIACLVGVIVTMPVVMTAMYKLYQQALGEDTPAAPPTPTALDAPTEPMVRLPPPPAQSA